MNGWVFLIARDANLRNYFSIFDPLFFSPLVYAPITFNAMLDMHKYILLDIKVQIIREIMVL